MKLCSVFFILGLSLIYVTGCETFQKDRAEIDKVVEDLVEEAIDDVAQEISK
jgi:hypothetical protein